MDILNKAVNKVGEVANQAAATAVQWRRLEAERRALNDLRDQALGLRAQIGEEMYKLWQDRRLPPSSLDHLFQAVSRTMAAIDAQRQVVDEMAAQFRRSGAPMPPDAEWEMDGPLLGASLPPPPVPAATTRVLALPPGVSLPADALLPPAPTAALSGGEATQPCPICGADVVSGKRYCGYCGSRIS